MKSRWRQTFFGLAITALALLWLAPAKAAPPALPEVEAEELLEQADIDDILSAAERPAGVLFVIADHDGEALDWFAPRILHYIVQLRRGGFTEPIVLLSHGDEMHGLTKSGIEEMPALAEILPNLDEMGVEIYVCGVFANTAGIAESDFLDNVRVADYAPNLINDHQHLGFEIIHLEPSW